MTDKERILMAIVTRIIPGAFLRSTNLDDYIEDTMFAKENMLKKGDLVFGMTSISMNDFLVGFVERVEKDCVVIREIGSSRLCNYYNESFIKINKEKLGYEVLEGTQYKIYNKVLKAFSDYTSYCTRFKSVSFDGNICTVQARKTFENDTLFEVNFQYNSKTTIKSIGELLEKADELVLKEKKQKK